MVDVAPLRVSTRREAAAAQASLGLGCHPWGAPRRAPERTRLDPPHTQCPVAAVARGRKPGARRPLQGSDGIAEPVFVQYWLVAPEEYDCGVATQDVPRRCMHALTQVAGRLAVTNGAVTMRKGAQTGIPRVRRTGQIEMPGRGCACRGHGMIQQGVIDARRPAGADGAREPGLAAARVRRFGEDDDRNLRGLDPVPRIGARGVGNRHKAAIIRRSLARR